MRTIKCQFLLIVLSLSLLLGGCSFFAPFGDSDGGDPAEGLDTFDFVTDETMILEDSSEHAYYNLTLYAGENYQIKTTVDDKLGEDYYFTYTTDDEIEGKFTLSENGTIETNPDLNENEVFTIDVELYRKGDSQRIARKHFIFSLLVGEYANIILTNDNLEYDSDTSTYSFTMDSGNHFHITYSVSYNTAYVLTFSLSNPEDSCFLTVDENGNITTSKTGEDKTGEIKIQSMGANGVLDTVFLKVTVKKSADFVNEFRVVNQTNARDIQNGDTLTMYQNVALSFDVRYNGQLKTNVIAVDDADLFEVDLATNTLKATRLGSGEVTFAYAEERITITVTVIQDKVISLSAANAGSDFVIINGTLHYLNPMYAIYESGARKEISERSRISTSVSGGSGAYKTVAFSYTEGGNEASVTYQVKSYTVEEYEGKATAYDNNDYFNQSRYGTIQILPNQGTVKLLVIPVWFTDSDLFFRESQKQQIIEDITYTVKGNRPDTELKSLKQYYEAQSYGAINMDITVSDFYHSATSYEDYTDYEESKLHNTHILGTNAIEWYFDTYTQEKFTEYDRNDDGYIDGVILYYGANYYGAKGDVNKTTAYEIDTNNDSEYAFNTLSFCSIGGLYGLQKQEPSAQLAVADLSATYSRAFRSSARTVIHEVGHMFGNVDLYEDPFATERYSPAGSFVMQDRNYGSHDPYHINRIGWSKPQIFASGEYALGDKITIQLDDFQSGGQNIILTNTWNSANSLYDEYLILELFAPVGLNEFDSKVSFMNLLRSGIRVWHVNSLLTDVSYGGGKTGQIQNGHQYELAYSNNDVTSAFDVLHLIRNNPNEAYNTTSALQTGGVLFEQGDSFDMQTFQSQFVNGSKLDNGEKLGWAFTVDMIYQNEDGTYSALITLERTDNTRTEFSQTVALNRSDLNEPAGREEYGDDIFGTDGNFSLVYQYVTPPSVYEPGYPISSDGMCLFASSDGNGGYIDLTIKAISGKTVRIDAISFTYSKLTNVSPCVLVGTSEIEGQAFDTQNSNLFGMEYAVNASSVRIQNAYDGTINHWSVLTLFEITIHYTIA